MEYKVISSDGHIDLAFMPPDLFVSQAPARWKDQVPHVVETEEGGRWFAEGKNLAAMALGAASGLANKALPAKGRSKRIDRMYEAGFYEGGPHPTTAELRIKDQEIDGVDAEVMYGILGVSMLMEDKELLRWVLGTYNDWAADFCKADPSRLVALACIPNDDPEIAAGELRRCASMGLKGADFAVGTAVKPVYHRDWDSLWAAADECEMPISFHTVGYSFRLPSDEDSADYETQRRAIGITLFQLAGAEFLSSIIFSGAVERYPGFRFVLGECGVGWVPYVLDRMDEEYEDQFRHLNFSLKPSEYWRRQGYTTFQHETVDAHLIQQVGEDNILWGSDYPHPDGIWPDSQQGIKQDLAGVDERVVRKITCENGGKLYGLLK